MSCGQCSRGRAGPLGLPPTTGPRARSSCGAGAPPPPTTGGGHPPPNKTAQHPPPLLSPYFRQFETMPTPPFIYQDPMPLGTDNTIYRVLSKEGVSMSSFEGREILKIEPEAIAFLTQQAFHDTSFMLRTAHVQQVAAILDDPEASQNDRYVAFTLLKNAEIAAGGFLPMCQETG